MICPRAKDCTMYEPTSPSCNELYTKNYCGIERNFDNPEHYDDFGYRYQPSTAERE